MMKQACTAVAIIFVVFILVELQSGDALPCTASEVETEFPGKKIKQLVSEGKAKEVPGGYKYKHLFDSWKEC